MSLADFLFDSIPERIMIFFRDSYRRSAGEPLSAFLQVILFESPLPFLLEYLLKILIGTVETKFGNPSRYELLKRFGKVNL